jgi:hypothetical protein
MHAIRLLFGYVRPHFWAVPALVGLGLVASAAEGVGIGMLIPLLDMLGGQPQEAGGGWFVSALRGFGAGLGSEARLALLAGTIFALVLLKSVVIFGYTALAEWFYGWIALEAQGLRYAKRPTTKTASS